MGAADAAANLLCEFNIAEKKDDKLTKRRKGKVILVKFIAIYNFSEFSAKPGAINKIKAGIKISTIKTKNSKLIRRILNTLLANSCVFILPFVNTEE